MHHDDLRVHDIDPPVRTLRWADIAPGRAMHAALTSPFSLRRPLELHTHRDFREIFLVVSGRGTHHANGRASALRPGDLVLMRPSDVHGFRLAPGQELAFLNVAFPETAWTDFIHFADAASPEWDRSTFPPLWHLPPAAHARAEAAFRQAIVDFRLAGRALHLARFLGAVLPLIGDEPPPENRPDLPTWLATALGAMEWGDNLAGGLPRLVELAGVSLPHLCRTMRARVGRSPTEFVNDLRMRNAAALLATTQLDLPEIADHCGFESLSYFHRQFRRRYGMTPLAYRRAEGSRIVTGG